MCRDKIFTVYLLHCIFFIFIKCPIVNSWDDNTQPIYTHIINHNVFVSRRSGSRTDEPSGERPKSVGEEAQLWLNMDFMVLWSDIHYRCRRLSWKVQRRMNVSRPGCSVSTYYRNNVSVTLFLPLFYIILIIMFGKLVATETLKWASWISTMSIVKDSFPITVPLFYHRNGRWILLHSMYFTFTPFSTSAIILLY